MSTKIEWVKNPDGTPGEVWNPVTGCTPVSEGCQNCYARRFAERLRGRFGYPEDDPFKITLHLLRLKDPLKWGKPKQVFVNSMGELFHPEVPDDYLDMVFAVMAASPHRFLVLTKRPERMLQWFAKTASGAQREILVFETGRALKLDMTRWPGWPLPNVWLGVTAENQRRADERIPILLQTPAAVRFVSVEPMLGPIDLCNIQVDPWTRLNALEGCGIDLRSQAQSIPNVTCPKLDWVIVGGETGPGARPMHPDWVRSLRDQAKAAGLPFFFKSWGQYCYPEQMPSETYRQLDALHNFAGNPDYESPWGVGKKAAGRLLDGRTWDEYPQGA